VTIHQSSGWLDFHVECAQSPTTGEVTTIMRALTREVQDAVFAMIKPLIPPPKPHPLGCHRPRVSDRLCFRGILYRLTTGSSWEDIEAILDYQVSDTTLRARRDEWIAAGVFDEIHAEAVDAFNKIIGLDLREVSIDGSLHKAPYGGEGTGPNPCDRAKCGWKWSVGVEAHGVPIGWAIDGANRNDVKLLVPTIDAIRTGGHRGHIGTLHLDRGYDYPKIRRQLNDAGYHDLIIQKRRKPGDTEPLPPMRLGLRWIVEATNSWLSNFGQLRRNTDRTLTHRHAALCLATVVLITGKLIVWRDRHQPAARPIR
jgi:transposase